VLRGSKEETRKGIIVVFFLQKKVGAKNKETIEFIPPRAVGRKLSRFSFFPKIDAASSIICCNL